MTQTSHLVRRLVTEIPGPRSRELQTRKSAAISAGIGVALPVYISRAWDGALEDVDGNVLIDLGSGIGVTGVGNANPRVVAALARQAELFTHVAFAITPYESYVEVGEALNRLTPGDHDKRSALFNSGAEAVENAVKIARAFTGRQAIVVLEHGYHGRTNLTMGMTAKAMPFKHGFGPFAPEVYRMPASYPLRDGLTGAEAAARTVSRIEKEIGADSVAAIVLEPIQGEGGFIVPAAGFVAELARFARESGALLVADEIQSGFCRTGDWFASEHEGVVPDLITTAKGIAGGMPLSAVTGRADVMDAVHAGGLGGTYTGNPVACAAALAAIEWMEDVDACGLARTIDAAITARLTTLKDRHPEVVEIRGRGAMKAIEIASPLDLTPDPARTAELNAFCHRNGVVTLVTGNYGNVMRFLPPLSIPSPALEEAFDVLDEAFAVTFG